MKQWRNLAMAGILAWLLLFLSQLSHFLDQRSWVALRAHSVVSSAYRTEIRRLASIQTGGKGGPGATSAPRGSSSVPPDGPKREALGRVVRTKDAAAWNPEEDGELRYQRRRMKIRMERARRWSLQNWGLDSRQVVERRDLEDNDLFVSRSKAVVQRLWRGNASAGMLGSRLQKALKDYLSSNKHQVAFKGQRRELKSSHEVLCELKTKARLRTLDGSEEPFASLGWSKLVPAWPLVQLQESQFNTCAVVTSAGAILNSALGEEIDSHDAVLRFNAAPTEGFERDVGRKTTIRIINSQILARPKHHFNTSSLYWNVTLVAWDPAPYSIDLQKWYQNPDYDLFTPYSERRRWLPEQPFYILHPGYIWRLWDVIQSNTQENIQPNPPSSGFIGILLMMALCREVHVYEYIPSVRQTDLCHYHEHYYDAACTLGAYHPLLYEKLLVQRINTAADEDVRQKGRVTLQGFSTTDCTP